MSENMMSQDTLEESRPAPPLRQRTNSVMRQSTMKSGNATTIDGKTAQVLASRGAFIYLPVVYSNDLVAGSWWFVVGSFLQVVIAVVMLVDVIFITTGKQFFMVPPDTGLRAFDDVGCWVLLIISGLFFTLGSYIFVRAFEEPPPPPFFTWRHCATDELAASWMYFFATFPAIPYSMVYLHTYPHAHQYWLAFLASCAFVAGSGFFVYTCYPSNHDESKGESNPKSYILRFVLCCCGKRSSLATHLSSDWLAACWFFFWSSAFWFVGSWLLLFTAANDRQIFAWISSAIEAFVYTVGSAYYVAGSYPPEESTKVNYDEPQNYPVYMQQYGYIDGEQARTQREDMVYVDRDDTMNVLHEYPRNTNNEYTGQQKQYSQFEL